MDNSLTKVSVHQPKEFLIASIFEQYVEASVQNAQKEYMKARDNGADKAEIQEKREEFRSEIRTKIIMSDIVTDLAAQCKGSNVVSDDESDEILEQKSSGVPDSPPSSNQQEKNATNVIIQQLGRDSNANIFQTVNESMVVELDAIDDYHLGRGGRDNYDNSSGQKRNYSDSSSHGSGSDGGGYGSGGGAGGYKRVRNDYQSNNGGDDGGGDDSRMETQRDTIFIQNLPHNVAPEDLREVFSQFGIIKNDRKKGEPKILIHKDKATGEGKGEATITYEDEAAAQAAINCYNEKEVLTNIVKISLAIRRASAFDGREGVGGDFSGYRGGNHDSSRDHNSNPY